MRADDLLNAIGEVDDAYIRRAHRKTRWKAFLTSLVTVLVLAAGAVLLMPADYLLARIEPDGSVNMGYVDPRSLENDKWTSLEQITCENGSVIGTTRIRRSLYGRYAVSRTEGTDTETVVGTVRGDDYRWDYVDREDRKDTTLKAGGSRRWLTTRFTTDLVGRIDSLYIFSGTANTDPGALLNAVRIEYMSTGVGPGLVVRQSHVLDNGTATGYRTFSYVNQKLSNTMDYDGSGNLLSGTEYVYDGYLCRTTTCLADGTVTEQSCVKYDWLDRVRWREIYDGEGNLTAKEIYRYRPWELFISWDGLWTLFAILSLAATLGIAVWDERFRRGDRYIPNMTAVQEQELAKELLRLTRSLDAVSAMLTAQSCSQETLERLTEEIAELNRHLKNAGFSAEKEE